VNTSVRKARWRYGACAVAAVLAAGASPTLAQTTSPATGKLVVGTMRAPPFASRGDDGQWSGLSIALWQRVAAEMGRDYEFRAFDYDPDGLFNAVEQGQVDLAIATLPITAEGEVRVDSWHAYFASGLGIAVRSEAQQGILATLRSLLTVQLLIPIAGLAGLLVLVGTTLWLIERRWNPGHFDPRPIHGVGDGVWWAAVTMTTTGYGDKTPVTWPGRALAVAWMYASIFCIATFSATLASSFVVDRLKTGVTGPGDLPGVRVGTVSGSAAELWLEVQRLRGRIYPFIIQASKALKRGEVEALVVDRAILGHMIRGYAWKDVHMLPQTLAVRDYAIAFPSGSPLKEDVNRALLKVMQQHDWKALVKRTIGDREP